MLNDLIVQTVTEYLQYLDEGGERQKLPVHIHDATLSEGKVHASALGRCPLVKAIERNREKTIPKKSMHSFSSLFLMQGGTRDAELFQESFLWRYPHNTEVEKTVEGHGIRGRMDIYHDGHVIEIKSRHISSQDAPPMLFLGDVYQTLAYGLILDVQPPKTLNTLLRTRWGYTLYTYRVEGNGFCIYDHHGKRWFPDYNRPEFINYAVIKSLADKHLKYLNQESIDDPMPNYLNVDGGRECGYFENGDKPKAFKTSFNGQNGKTVKFIPTCPHWCHHKEKPEYVEVEETEFGSKKYREVEKELV